MKCPACFGLLKEVQVGSVKVDVCDGGCGGLWFDAFELQRVDEESEAAGEWLLRVARNPDLQLDMQRKRTCPRCEDIKLKRRFFSAKRQVEIDECPGCGGYWLDAGELERIRGEIVQQRQEEELAHQSVLSTQVIRYLYRIRLEERGEESNAV